MDPATAFQLACGAIQLVDLGLKATRTCREIHKNGSSLTTKNEQIEHEARQLKKILSELSSKLAAHDDKTGLTSDQRQL